jgi:hypothetical protein
MFLSGMLARGRTRVKVNPPLWLTYALRWLPAAAWMGGIFFLSQRSMPVGVATNNVAAIAAHLGLYAGLALLLYWALSGSADSHHGVPAWVLAAVAFALTVLYGVVDEVHQAFVPSRVASEADLALDAAGAVIGVALASLVANLLKTLRSRR